MWDYLEQEYNDALARWKSAVADFERQLVILRGNEAKARELGEYDAWLEQYDKAVVMKQVISDIQSQLGGAVDWFKNVFGLNGLQGMGAIPLIPVAVIVGSISAVTALTYAMYSYNSELERKWAYVKARPGTTPAELEQILNSGGVLPSSSNIAAFVVIAGLALYFGPKLLKGK